MSFVDEVLARIVGSGKLDDAGKAIVADLVETNRAWLEGLGAELAAQVMRTVFAGGHASWDQLVSRMDQGQLLALLGGLEQAVDRHTLTRAAAVARMEAFAAGAADTALRLLAGVLLSAL